MKIGVISDTHNYLDSKIHRLFSGVSHILHAGDIGNLTIISELEEIAPVTAVYGNTDVQLPFKETEIVTLASIKFLIHHIVNPLELSERVSEQIKREQPRVVVFGHSHKRYCGTIGGIFYFNPGYAGKPKLNLHREAAILHCIDNEIRPEFLAL